jgi:hypothetical protein
MYLQPSPIGPVALLVVVLVVDVRVYLDALALADQRRPVVASIGRLVLETPTAWTIACLLLWIVFFPMYLVARSKA